MKLETGYAPRPLQSEIHQQLRRFNVLVCHRRFGKTVLCINELVDRSLRSTRERPRHAYIAPLYRQAKQVAWDYLKLYTACFGPRRKVSESELRVDLPGDRRIQLFGADNPDALRGMYLDGAVLDEYAQMPPKLWGQVIRPALADRVGFAIFIGTPMGHNAFWAMSEFARTGVMPDLQGLMGERRELVPGEREDWFWACYRASETGVIDPRELSAMRAEMSDDEYQQELECSFEAAIKGAYYGTLMREAADEGRIGKVPHDTTQRVETWWDLGYRDATAIWFVQRVGYEIHLVDYYENSGEPISHYAGVLAEKGRAKDQGGRGFLYSDHWLPHDAYGKSLETGKTLYDALSALGVQGSKVPDRHVQHGIEAARGMLPRCWFDEESCRLGIECLRQYRKDWDDEHKVFRNKPLHDWSSHGADAFRYGALVSPKQAAEGRPIEYRDTGAYV